VVRGLLQRRTISQSERLRLIEQEKRMVFQLDEVMNSVAGREELLEELHARLAE
jgi:hypothetical protein